MRVDEIGESEDILKGTCKCPAVKREQRIWRTTDTSDAGGEAQSRGGGSMREAGRVSRGQKGYEFVSLLSKNNEHRTIQYK